MDAPQWNGGPEPDYSERLMLTCAQCNKIIPGDDALTTACGDFCSDDCAAQWWEDFAHYMEKEGHTVLQPCIPGLEDRRTA